jgi:hypothetical protein
VSLDIWSDISLDLLNSGTPYIDRGHVQLMALSLTPRAGPVYRHGIV